MQDYKMVMRSVYSGATMYLPGGELHVMNAAEAQDYLNSTYLENGYKIQEVHYAGEVLVNELEQSNSPRAMRFVWHLVKELIPRA